VSDAEGEGEEVVLSLGALGKGQERYYSELSREDYYTAGGEPPGEWWGEGAGLLHLSGTVRAEDLRELFSGFRGGKPLTQNAGSDTRRPGWDATFSAPKSVSFLYGAGGEYVRAEVRGAHAAAVREALRAYEELYAQTRKEKAGIDPEKGFIVAALFEHGTSRAQDANLHTHCLIVNTAVLPDGRTGALDSRGLYDQKMVLGALYRAHLAFELERRLGVKVERVRTWFEVTGVPKELLQECSTRRAEVLSQLRERGEEGPVAAARAALLTRGAKEHLPREELFARWEELGKRHGFGPEEVKALLGQSQGRFPAEELKAALGVALKRITTSHSHFSEADLLRATAEEAQGRGLGAGPIREGVRAKLRTSPDIVALGRRGHELRYTTRAMLSLEQKLLSAVESLRENSFHRVSEVALHPVLAARPTMTEEQRAALYHITTRSGAVQAVSGVAGSGKSYLLGAAREAWEREGFQVMGCAIAGKAAQGLEEGSGIRSTTVAKLIGCEDFGTVGEFNRPREGQKRPGAREWLLNKRTILVADEAGMIPTRQMERLVAAVEKAGGKLVLVGDSRQLQPITAGGPFHSICERVGHVKLTQIVRQREEWARRSVHEFASGEAHAALSRYAERGLLRVSDTRAEAMSALVASYKEDGLAQCEGKLILAATNRDVRALNEKVQAERKDAGLLGPASVRVCETTVFENDRVLFTKNSGPLGVKNGSLGTVRAVDDAGKVLVVRLDDSGRFVHVPLASYESLKLSYAVTTHKGQGATTDRAWVLCGGPMTDLHLSYVQASRARDRTSFWCSRDEAGEELAGLARAMSRSHEKDLALDVATAPSPAYSRTPEVSR
jgi:Ti-type conjugative transfer relaxase TraA